jgi:putative tryptophan/tyrosine transport system substrate-binding protein
MREAGTVETSMRRREFIALIAGAALSSSPVFAQKRTRIGWLVFGDASLGPIDKALKDGLAQNGLVDGRNVEIIYRYANGNPARLAELADELVAQNPDLLIAIGGDVCKVLFDASRANIPVVGGVSESPILAGLAASLAKPGKNFTGVTWLTDEMAAKRMEILKEVVPDAKRVAVIFNPQHFDDEVTFARKAAQSLGIEITTHPIKDAGELDGALRTATANQPNSLFVIPSRLTGHIGDRISQYGLERRLPVITAWHEFVIGGALLSYGPNRVVEAKRVAGYVQKVVQGAKPADLPVEQPVKFELVLNLKTARSIGLNISRDFLLRADDLIE